MTTIKKIILLALTSIIMSGCLSDEEVAKIEEEGFAVLTFDSCEYVLKEDGYRGFFAHKGNCRFCKERRQKELEELIIKLKK